MAAIDAAPDYKPPPVPPPTGSPYSVKNHRLFKDNISVNYCLTEMHGGAMAELPSLVVIHYTGTEGLESPLNWLTVYGDRRPDQVVSAHLIIDKDGTVYQILPFNMIAYHAGRSSYEGRQGCNSFSIGIENVGTGKDWPAAQVQAIIHVIDALKRAYPIVDIEGHDEVAPGRKPDPGKLFPWNVVEPEGDK
jgi:N-acetyl-anhydromuramyl-L-alanine amidase AmpD